MKQLGDLILPDSLQWVDRYARLPVTQTVVQTLGGTPVVFGCPKVSGWSLTLVAEEEVTWLDMATVEALLLMAGEAGASFSLVWEEAMTCTVMFRHHEPPALDLKPLWPHHNQFVGSIKLMAT